MVGDGVVEGCAGGEEVGEFGGWWRHGLTGLRFLVLEDGGFEAWAIRGCFVGFGRGVLMQNEGRLRSRGCGAYILFRLVRWVKGKVSMRVDVLMF